MPKGGLRIGAGRPGWKPKAEQLYTLDIRKLKRDGLLIPGVTVDLKWSRYGKVVGGASATFRDGKYLLLRNGSWSQHINIESTPCNYGGVRHWFECQGCGRRCAVVYLRGQSFECRSCKCVVYTSQSEDFFGRLWRQQKKLEQKLNERWQRPKGMHKSTFDQIIRRIIDCEESREDALAIFASRLIGLNF